MAISNATTGLSEKLRDLRNASGITQEDLSARMNVTRQTISGWERGRSEPDIEIIKKLSQIFDVSVDELLSAVRMKTTTTDYRKGGIIMLPFVTAGILIAWVFQAPWMALCSIAFFGYVASIVLILLGKRVRVN